MISNSILSGFLIGFTIAAVLIVSLFVAVVAFFIGKLFFDEFVLIIKEIKEEPKLTRAERKLQEIQWEAFLEDLNRYHEERPLNVFRDGVSLV